MDFIYLRTLCEVAKWGSLTQAAEVLGYAQSSVTAQIQKLEEQYGVVLFERYGRRMRPTQAGEMLLHYAQQMLELHLEAKAILSQQEMGTITIGTIETLAAFYLPPVLQSFRQTYPKITIALQSGNEISIVQAVKDGHCDLGLVLDVVSSDSDLASLLVRKEEFAIVAHPDSPYAHMTEVPAHDLTNARFILTEEGCTYRAFLLQALREAGITYQIVGEFGSIEAIKQCVRYDLGIAFLPRVTIQAEVEHGILQAIPLAAESNLYTQAIYLKRKWQSRAFQDLLNLLGSPHTPDENQALS